MWWRAIEASRFVSSPFRAAYCFQVEAEEGVCPIQVGPGHDYRSRRIARSWSTVPLTALSTAGADATIDAEKHSGAPFVGEEHGLRCSSTAHRTATSRDPS